MNGTTKTDTAACALTRGFISSIPDGDEIVLRRERCAKDIDGDIANISGSYFRIVEHRPRAIEVGDTVDLKDIEDTNNAGEVAAIVGDQAWVKWKKSGSQIIEVKELKRV